MTTTKKPTTKKVPTEKSTSVKHVGNIKVHGRIFVGTVIKPVFHKTVTIEFERRVLIPKYERYEKRRTRVKAHVPEGLDIKQGDLLKIGETRPLSKTKNFIALEVVNK